MSQRIAIVFVIIIETHRIPSACHIAVRAQKVFFVYKSYLCYIAARPVLNNIIQTRRGMIFFSNHKLRRS